MDSPLAVTVLVTDAFGGIGGIAKFNRDLLQALDACTAVQRVDVIPRLIPSLIEDQIPESVVYDRRAARGKMAFMRRVLACALRRAPVDLVICGHIHLLPAAWLLARARGARLALILHGIEAWPPRGAIATRLLRSVDAFLAVSGVTARRFAAWSGVDADRIAILPNSVDLDRFQPAPRDPRLVARYGLQSNRTILTMGRLIEPGRHKGFDEVIDAMPALLKSFPKLKYVIVGDGPDRPRLERKAEALGLKESVIFTGWAAESQKVAHYNLADAYVMPSRGEGFGIVLIEAAACGVPVIGSSVDGSREALLDGRLGNLVDPSNPDELTGAVTAALAAPPHRERNELVVTFDVAHFRARAAAWIREQARLMGQRRKGRG